ncbi:GNAT family N-acetyltransferase [Streptomyces sp. TLI_171]|uniref:GNAT family N-acetyltransferase n=1 Tax=Streptomyces sp. TLI_171 TaxID=1938859 RepID=UPI000C1A596E|nr:GNAT family protein [Streptomyces sp. TLI_171]RKE20541.1 ribosomal-protein-alanine N-acetyltransferase [Streptomyces sp. TLI_171]
METVRLAGPRLTLREYRHTPEEVAALHAVHGDPETVRHLPFDVRDFEDCADQIELYLEAAEESPRTHYRLAVDDPAGTPIGQAALTREDEHTAQLGCVLRRDTWGRGHAGEVTALLCALGFDILALHRLHARCDPANPAAARVLARAGFRYEGRIRAESHHGGRRHDALQYSLLAPEWRQARGGTGG